MRMHCSTDSNVYKTCWQSYNKNSTRAVAIISYTLCNARIFIINFLLSRYMYNVAMIFMDYYYYQIYIRQSELHHSINYNGSFKIL